DVPEPRGRRPREDELHMEPDALPLTAGDEPARVRLDRRRAGRPEEWRRRDRIAVAAEVEVRRAALDLAAEKEVQGDAAVAEPPVRAVSVHLYAQPGLAAQLHRRALRRHWRCSSATASRTTDALRSSAARSPASSGGGMVARMPRPATSRG